MNEKEGKIVGVLKSWHATADVNVITRLGPGGATCTARANGKIVATSVGSSVKEALDRLGEAVARAWVKSIRKEEPKRFGSP